MVQPTDILNTELAVRKEYVIHVDESVRQKGVRLSVGLESICTLTESARSWKALLEAALKIGLKGWISRDCFF